MITSIIALDQTIVTALYAIRDPRLVDVFTWITKLGEVTIVFAFTAVVVIILSYRKQWVPVAGIIVSVLGSTAATYVLKELVARPRPSIGILTYAETTPSFPSTHAALAIAFYGFILFLVWNTLSPVQQKIKFAAILMIILAVGFSRLYLGVHYLSDVLVGYLVGAVFFWLGVVVSRKFSLSKSS